MSAESEALHRVIEGDMDKAKEILRGFYRTELNEFEDSLLKLRNLIEVVLEENGS